jgi:cellobiose phosphorylase
MPPHWDHYSMVYHFGTTPYQIEVSRIAGEQATNSIQLDGLEVGAQGFPLLDDQQVHHVSVSIGTGKLRIPPV